MRRAFRRPHVLRTASRGVLAVAAILFLTSTSSPAQEFWGRIIGTVSDPTGGVLPGVTVTVTNTETHVAQTVVTDAQGLYQVRYLNPGTYSVTAELQGFKKFSRIDNNVRPISGSATHARYFPSTLPNVRTDNLHLMDLGLYKNFQMPNRMKLQIRVEAINALNYTVLWNPNVDPRNATFGFINQDRNNPRDIQIGARVTS